MQHIPMKSTGEAVGEVLASRVQGTMAAVIAIKGNMDNPRIKLLAYTGAKRSPLVPELPTVAEAGVPDYKFGTWYALLAPVTMPKAEVEKIHAAMNDVLGQAAVRERLTQLGMELSAMSPNQLNEMLKADYDSAAALVETSGARVE